MKRLLAICAALAAAAATSAPEPLLVGYLGGVAEGRGLHQLQILLILCGGAASHLVDPLADVPVADPFVMVKSREKLIVPAELRRGDKTAHGKGINQPVV